MRAKSDGPRYSGAWPHLFFSLSFLFLPLVVLNPILRYGYCLHPIPIPAADYADLETDAHHAQMTIVAVRSPSAATGFGGKLAGNMRGFGVGVGSGAGAASRGRSQDAGTVSEGTFGRRLQVW
ncbi:hypothetical protein BC826DRAFT_512809 [Russula brevipes]|nr:hypothetical protein BC826DRAFT_512809 [Russula brevipes]